MAKCKTQPKAAELEALLDEILDACLALDRWALETEDVPMQAIAKKILRLAQDGQGQLP